MIKKHTSYIRDICKAFQVKQLYVFGSGADNSLKEQSDLDFLISFRDDLSPDEYADNYFSMHQELEKLFNREIDLITERSLSNPFFIDSINSTKKLIYDEKSQKVSV